MLLLNGKNLQANLLLYLERWKRAGQPKSVYLDFGTKFLLLASPSFALCTFHSIAFTFSFRLSVNLSFLFLEEKGIAASPVG